MLTHRFDDAFLFASEAHRRQTRKGANIPCLSHLMAVSALVIEAGGDEDQAIAALLHDAIEDQGGAAMRARIEARFGSRVARLVRACSDAEDQSLLPWRARKEAYLASIASKPRDAVLVTACDKLHNATAIVTDKMTHGAAVFDRFTAAPDEVRWYYTELARALAARLPGPLTQRLAAIVALI